MRSLKLRITLGFLIIIGLMATISIFSTLRLNILNNASDEIAERSNIVNSINQYAHDIFAQSTQLRTFAFSGLEQDKIAVENSRAVTALSLNTVIQLLHQTGDEKHVEALNQSSKSFVQIFNNIEGRLGTEGEALQVIIPSIDKLKKSSANLVKFLSNRSENDAKEMAKNINGYVSELSRTSVEYMATANISAFESALNASESIDNVIRNSAQYFKELPRRERSIVRFSRRDNDNIRQSLKQKFAADLALNEALDQLSAEVQNITSITNELKEQSHEAQNNALNFMVDRISEVSSNNKTGLLIGGLIAVIVALAISRSVTVPLTKITQTITELANGEKSLEIPYQNRKDEIGSLASAASIFKTNTMEFERIAEEKIQSEKKSAEDQLRRKSEQEKLEKIQNQKEKDLRNAEQQRQRDQQLKLADQLESEIASIVMNVASMSTQLGQDSEEMKQNADKTNSLSETAADKSDETKSNMIQVSSAMRNMEQAITDVSTQVSKSKSVADKAMHASDKSQIQMKILSDSTSKIKDVVNLIQDIAEQTKLLALNANIEAARAGEAGKGFAVVASEVKKLATETAQATESIEQQVKEMTDVTEHTVTTMNALKSTIEDMNEMSSMISKSVDSQLVSKQSIEQSVGKVTSGVNALQQDINNVSAMARSSDETATNVWKATTVLEDQSEKLENILSDFLVQIREDKKLAS